MSGTVWHLSYLAEMMGDSTTEAEVKAMRDLLIEDGSLDWVSDANGGSLKCMADHTWERFVREAIRQAQQ